jgi:hypothetical protein
MGLFSRKSPEEKRIDKFKKTEKNANKRIGNVLCPIWQLYQLSENEEEYKKTCDYYKKWFEKYVDVQMPKLKMWGVDDYWKTFTANTINGMLSFMVVNQYDESLLYCNKLLEYEEIILEKKIGRGNAGGFIAAAKLVAASAGVGGNEKQREFLKQVKFIKAVMLKELGKLEEAKDLLKDYEQDYGLTFKKSDDYFNENFKYKGSIYVKDI